MLSRRLFLQRSLAAVGLLALGRLPSPPPAAAELDLGVIRDARLTATNDFQIFGERSLVASGGLCAPIAPYYSLALINAHRPIRDSLPSLNADRGVAYGPDR